MLSSDEERVALAFLGRFWADRDAGKEAGLTEYLGLFPGHEEAVAREYLQALAEHRRANDGGAEASSDENRLGPYRLIKELGRGGQGVVWLAEDTRLGRKVALKVLSGLGPGAEGHLARFRREAELASKLDHPGICGVHDTGIEGGVPYIALRYVEGETLAQKLARLGKSGDAAAAKSFLNFEDDDAEAPVEVPATAAKTSVDRAELDRTIVIFEQAANALHAAHEVGIIHRDIKPGNLMIAKGGQPVLLDFGLARDDSEDAGPSLTQTGDLFGTPAYMSPEQITGRRVKLDRRSDIYSLGVTLYECLTLKRPFEAPTRESLYQAIMSKEAQPARKLNRQIPGDLEVVLQCAMAKDRDKRYQTAADLAEDLRRVRTGEPILAKKVSMLGRAWRWSKRRPAAAALLAVLILGTPTISGLGVWYWTHLDDVRAQERAQTLEAVEDQLEIGFYEVHHGDPKIAVAAFEKALAIDFDTPEAVVGLACAHLKLRKPEVALAALARAESSTTSASALLTVKADVLRAMGKIAESDALLAKAPKADGVLGWFVAGARIISRDFFPGEATREMKAAYLDAEGFLQRAVLASSRPRRAYYFLLAAAQVHGTTEAGSVTADTLQALWPQQALSWFYCGLATNGVDPKRSLAAYREAIRLRTNLTMAHNNLGIGLMEEGKLEEGAAAFRECIRQQPDLTHAHYNLGNCLRTQGKLDESIAEYREAIRSNPNFDAAYVNLGEILSREGKWDEAIAAFREAIRRKPENAMAHYNLGSVWLAQGKLEEAIAEYREAIHRRSDLAEAHTNLGLALVMQPKLDEAVVALREAIRLRPNLAQAHKVLGDALREQGALDEAIAAYRDAIRLNPEYVNAHWILGATLGAQGKLEEAIVALREAVRLNPDRQEFQRPLEDTIGRLMPEIAQIRNDIKEDPLDAELWNELAWIFVDPAGNPTIHDPKRALPHARKAVELSRRRDAKILNTLAVALAANGELREAIGVQDEILKLMNGKDVSGLKLADAEAALENYRKRLAAEDNQTRPSK